MTPRVSAAWREPGARVVFYGTSLTASGGWAEALAAEMLQHNPTLVAVNAAEGGRESRWGREHFAERVLVQQPTVLFLEFAINDAVERFALPPEESVANLEAMLDRLAEVQPNVVPILQVMNPVIDRPSGHDGHRPYLPVYEACWREVARRRGVALVDHAPAWEQWLAQGADAFRQLVPDGLHPTLAAYQRLVLPTLRAALGLEEL